jgi:hypothetical protein
MSADLNWDRAAELSAQFSDFTPSGDAFMQKQQTI